NTGGGRAAHRGGEGKRAEEADDGGARTQVERPAGDDGACGAGCKNLREGALRHGGVQRAAPPAARGRGLAGRAVRPGGSGQRGARRRNRFRLRDREGGGDAGERGEHGGGTKRLQGSIRNCTSRAITASLDLTRVRVVAGCTRTGGSDVRRQRSDTLRPGSC